MYLLGHSTSKATTEKLKQFNWELIPHPPYSPDPASFLHHLFRSLLKFLNGRNF
ncbi:hypothetical protein WH47_10512 [Habropoda laboriosa]|uniref:Histone-lysine N-methyltransferase SETMAR n=1 Tax=Habropoda laboriosa TaxID=597456 RepID=A0A0L7R9X9_9HYME|nr:hypothetical protein WH47_10512 [Habropoda laboriosa]